MKIHVPKEIKGRLVDRRPPRHSPLSRILDHNNLGFFYGIPMGLYEIEDFAKHKDALIKIVTDHSKATTIFTERSSKGGFRSDNLRQTLGGEELEEIIWLENQLLAKINELKTKLFPEAAVELNITNSWAVLNRAKSGDWNVPHAHSDSFMSGAFYIKVPKEGDFGKLYLMNPNYMMFFKGLNDRSIDNLLEYDPVEGQLLIFPSDLIHFVGPNLSAEDRIVYSFNTTHVDSETGKPHGYPNSASWRTSIQADDETSD